MDVVNRIESPINPVLCKLAYMHMKTYHNFVPLSIYSTNKYKWVHRYYKNNHSGFETNTHLTKKKPA